MNKMFYVAFSVLFFSFQIMHSMSIGFDLSIELDPVWGRAFLHAVNKGKFARAKRLLRHIERPQSILNGQDKKGNTPLMIIFKQSIERNSNGFDLIELIINNYKDKVNFNVQDALGNTFLMHVLQKYNDMHYGLLSKKIAALILNNHEICSKLDLDLMNKEGETIRDLALKVKLDPELAFLIGVDISPRRKTMKDYWSSLIESKQKSFKTHLNI